MSAASIRALEFLRSRPNPFDDFVRPQRQDDRFQEVHEPEVFRQPRQLLLDAIDSYRLLEGTKKPPTRVISVWGERGAGKTHLLESIVHREDGRTQLIIRRQTEDYTSSIPFQEYLNNLLVQTLTSRDATHGYRWFEAVCVHLASQILAHTVQELTSMDCLWAQRVSGWHWLRTLWFGTRREPKQPIVELADDLARPSDHWKLGKVVGRHHLSPKTLGQLALSRISRLEHGEDVGSLIRRELYATAIRAALLNDREAVRSFFEADYRPRSSFATRSEVVERLLQTLTETCAIVNLPVVFAFDNLEGLLAPRGQMDEQRAAAFLDGLAQAVDHTSGFLVLLFAESDLFLSALQQVGTFARGRLDLGVSLPGQPSLSRIELTAPTEEETKKLVAHRMSKVLDGFDESLDETFPFEPAFIEEIAENRALPIRGKLQALQDKYNEAVFAADLSTASTDESATARDAAATPESSAAVVLERVWNGALTKAGQRLDLSSSLATLEAELTQNLGMLVEASLPIESIPELRSVVHPSVAVGDHDRYGFVTVFSFEGKSGSSRLAVGFLVAGGKGMSVDLRAKFDAFTDGRSKADRLIVLSPVDGSDRAVKLPPKTKEVWEESTYKEKSEIRPVSLEGIRKLLAFPSWQEAVAQQASNLPQDRLRAFVLEQFAGLFKLVATVTKGLDFDEA